MRNKKHKLLLTATVLFLIFVLPIVIYLARTQQLFRPRAAFGEVTVHLVPLEVTKNIGEPFLVEVHVNSGTIPLSGITVSLSGSPGGIVIQEVAGATTTADAFTDLIYDKNTDPLSFTVLSRKPTAQLPTGSVKVAQLSVISYESGTHTLGINIQKSAAVGFNGASEDVALTVAAGTQVSYTMTGSLCKLAQCVAAANITANPSLRADNKYNVLLNFPSGDVSGQIFKIYRNTGAIVPEAHPDINLVGILPPSTTASQQFTDTNNGVGFEGQTNIHYDVDTYTVCSSSITPTIPVATQTPTTTVVPTTTPFR